MSEEKRTGVNLPNYFYYSGVLFKLKNNILSEVLDEAVPSTNIGLVATDELGNRLRYMQGRLLTIIDASFVDKEQKKAVKDLVRQIMSEEHSRLEDSATGFTTLSQGDMVQYSGSVDKFYEDNTPNN